MKFKEIYNLEHLLAEYGMNSSGAPTPVGAQQMGANAKATAQQRNTDRVQSTSPSTTPQQTTSGDQTAQPVTTPAAELSKGDQFVGPEDTDLIVVSARGEINPEVPNDSPNTVVVQDDQDRLFAIEPDTEIVVPQAAQESVFDRFDRLGLSEKLTVLGKLDKRKLDETWNRVQQMSESTGLANRKPGDVFRNPQGDELYFKKIEFLPQGGGKLEYDELADLVDQIEQQHAGITWENSINRRMGGVAVVTLTDKSGNLVHYGRYFQNINPDPIMNKMDNVVGDYKLYTAASRKEKAGLSPTDLLVDLENLTADRILEQLRERLGEDNSLYQLAVSVSDGNPLPITITPPPELADMFTAFRDYFCEILQPLAIQQGIYKVEKGDAPDVVLGSRLSDTVISFHNSKTGGLSDSVLIAPNGNSVKISTKASGKDAEASVVNILNSSRDLADMPGGEQLLSQHADAIQIIQELDSRSSEEGPLYLAQHTGILTESEAQTIRDLKGQSRMSLSDIEQYEFTDNLNELASLRTPKQPDNINLYVHMVSAVAYKVAYEVNQQGNFSNAAAEILNHSRLVQVYTSATESKGEWTLTEFSTLYPGESIEGVYLSAKKHYASTNIKGKMTFKIDRTGKGPPDLNIARPSSVQPKPERKSNRVARELEPEAPGELGRQKVESLGSQGKTIVEHSVQSVKENLRDWFGKGKKGGTGGGGWDAYNSKGERTGKCGDTKGGAKPKCLSKSKAASLRNADADGDGKPDGKSGIARAVKRKRKQDPKKNRKGKAKNVANKKESLEYTGIPFDQCPGCGGPICHISEAEGKKDACYHKVKSRYKIWPSAYASGALVQCRKAGAKNWGNKSQKKTTESTKPYFLKPGELSGSWRDAELHKLGFKMASNGSWYTSQANWQKLSQLGERSWRSLISESTSVHEGVPNNDGVAVLRRLLSQPLLTSDIRSQMEAYIAVQDPEMIHAFRLMRAEQGESFDLREILRNYAKQLHPRVKQQLDIQ